MMDKAHVPAHSGFRPKEYAHIVLASGQPEALIDFYCKVLGMQVVMRSPVINFLSWDDSQDRIAIVRLENAQPRAKNSPGLHHAAFEIGSLKELVDQYRALKTQGIHPDYCMNHGVATSMYYSDPDQNHIELTVGAFASREALNEWLDEGAFNANPVGVFIDPEELCARVDGEDDEYTILRPAADHADALPAVIKRMKELQAG